VLVDWSHRAGQLDDLSRKITDRLQHPQAKVTGLVMQTLVALTHNQLDQAKQALTELAKQVQVGTLPAMVQLACHAALPASDHTGLQEPAFAILQVAVNQQLQTAQETSGELSLGKLVSKVNRYLADDPVEVKKFFESYLVGRQNYYSRYSGTYGQYLQWRRSLARLDDAGRGATNGTPGRRLGGTDARAGGFPQLPARSRYTVLRRQFE
jgi:hypothetical protein